MEFCLGMVCVWLVCVCVVGKCAVNGITLTLNLTLTGLVGYDGIGRGVLCYSVAGSAVSIHVESFYLLTF